jgi:hypothetical protein
MATNDPYEALIELCRRLTAASTGRQVEWETSDEDMFAFRGRMGSVFVGSRDKDGEAPYELVIVNPENQKLETLTSDWLGEEQTPAAWNEPLALLYRAARRRALNTDAAVAALIESLPPVPSPESWKDVPE